MRINIIRECGQKPFEFNKNFNLREMCEDGLFGPMRDLSDYLIHLHGKGGFRGYTSQAFVEEVLTVLPDATTGPLVQSRSETLSVAGEAYMEKYIATAYFREMDHYLSGAKFLIRKAPCISYRYESIGRSGALEPVKVEFYSRLILLDDKSGYNTLMTN